ncbi:hypothetical protein MMPV_005287 [Pyropia vietnamensis]
MPPKGSSRRTATIGLTGTSSGQTRLSFGPASGAGRVKTTPKQAVASAADAAAAAPDSPDREAAVVKPRGRGRMTKAVAAAAAAAAIEAAAAGVVDVDSESEEEVVVVKRGRGRPTKAAAAAAAAASVAATKQRVEGAPSVERTAKAEAKTRAPKRSAAAAGVDDVKPSNRGGANAAAAASAPSASADAGAPPAAKKARPGPPWASGAPPRAGEKDVPAGAPNCLRGLVFCLTGVLESLHRDVAANLCKQYGGRVVSALSRNVTHALVGDEPGASKMKKLEELRAAGKAPVVIDEDGLFELLLTRPGDGPRPGAEPPVMAPSPAGAAMDEGTDGEDAAPVPRRKAAAAAAAAAATAAAAEPTVAAAAFPPPPAPCPPGAAGSVELWVDKYRPKTMKDLVANPKLAKDLEAWLSGWSSARAAERLARAARGSGPAKRGAPKPPENAARAALLAGPPGIGKTSMAHVVARACGYEPHEMNASDTRNKAAIAGTVADIVLSSSISSFFPFKPKAGDTAAAAAAAAPGGRGRKGKARAVPPPPTNLYPNGQLLIMDEVDGMSGGDRGGMQELIKVIAATQVPIICICNDDQAQKVRTLANHCYKLKFRRPMVAQARTRLMEIAMREGYRHIDPQTAEKLAESCHGDIRAMINLLQTWRSTSDKLSFTDVTERMKAEGKTRTERSPFELFKEFFDVRSGRSVNDRLDDFFLDSDLMPLFVQENYPNASGAAGRPHLLAAAADSISEGDLVNQIVRSEQRWDLMPASGLLSAIRPGAMVAGYIGARPSFPAWLGKYSTERKNVRLVKELEMRCKAGTRCSQSARAFRLDYVPALTSAMVRPLTALGAAGIAPAVAVLDAYYMNREDVEALVGLGIYAKGSSPWDAVDSKVKTALTRAYSAGDHARSTVSEAHFGVKAAGASAKPTPVAATAAEVVVDDAEEAAAASDSDSSDVDDTTVAKRFLKSGGAKGGGGKAGRAIGGGAKGKRK